MQLGRLITILAILSATGVDARRKAVAVEPDAYGQPAAPVATTAVAPAMNSPVPVPDPAAYSAPAPAVAAPPPVVAAPPVDYTYAAPSQVVAAPSPMMASPSSEYTYAAPVPIVAPPVDYTYAAPSQVVAAPSPMMASPSSEYTYAAPIPIVAAPSSVMASPSPVAPPVAYTYAAPSQVVAAPSPPAAVYYTSPAPVLSSPSPIVEYTAPSVPVATSPVQMGAYAPTTTHVKKHKTKTVQPESSSVGAVASDYGYGAPSPIATYVTPSQTTIYGTVYPAVTTTSEMHMASPSPSINTSVAAIISSTVEVLYKKTKTKKHSKFTTQQPVATYGSSPAVSTNVSPDIILPPSPIYQAPQPAPLPMKTKKHSKQSPSPAPPSPPSPPSYPAPGQSSSGQSSGGQAPNGGSVVYPVQPPAPPVAAPPSPVQAYMVKPSPVVSVAPILQYQIIYTDECEEYEDVVVTSAVAAAISTSTPTSTSSQTCTSSKAFPILVIPYGVQQPQFPDLPYAVKSPTATPVNLVRTLVKAVNTKTHGYAFVPKYGTIKPTVRTSVAAGFTGGTAAGNNLVQSGAEKLCAVLFGGVAGVVVALLF